MATGDGSSGWWNSFVKSAKEKSISALEIIKTDLAEFTQTMTNDTSSLLNQASAQLIEKTNTASSYLISDASDSDTKRVIKSSSSGKSKKIDNNLSSSSAIQERYKEDLASIQSSETSYLPDEKLESTNEFTQWQETFNPDNFKSVISNLLIENSSMRLVYSQLVPSQVSNIQFWCRYFYRVNQLDEENKKRMKLIERASDESKLNKEESIDWDDETDEVDTKNEPESQNNQTETITNDLENVKIEENETTVNEAASSEQNSQPELSNNEIEEEKKELEDNKAINKPEVQTKEEKLESSQKTEDSDEWEKVSDVVKDEISQDEGVTPKNENSKDKLKTKGNSDAKKGDDDWDDWD